MFVVGRIGGGIFNCFKRKGGEIPVVDQIDQLVNPDFFHFEEMVFDEVKFTVKVMQNDQVRIKFQADFLIQD